jgi:methyl-accepting chemotaxis protein
MTNLESFQKIIAQALTALSVIHIPILALIAALLDRDIVATVVVAAALATAPALALMLHRPVRIVAFALAVALVGQTSILVYLFSGHPWQVEMHFYYFAVLAMLSGFCEWTVIVTAAALIAGHHLSLNFFLPAAVYPGGSNFFRVVVHAVIVVVETAMLIGIGHAIRSAFAQAESSRHESERAAAELQRIGLAREK